MLEVLYRLKESRTDAVVGLQPEGLAQQLRISPKALRAALRFLEQEQVVWRDHRQHKRRRGGAPHEAVSGDSTAGAMRCRGLRPVRVLPLKCCGG